MPYLPILEMNVGRIQRFSQWPGVFLPNPPTTILLLIMEGDGVYVAGTNYQAIGMKVHSGGHLEQKHGTSDYRHGVGVLLNSCNFQQSFSEKQRASFSVARGALVKNRSEFKTPNSCFLSSERHRSTTNCSCFIAKSSDQVNNPPFAFILRRFESTLCDRYLAKRPGKFGTSLYEGK